MRKPKDLYGPTIRREVDEAVDRALAETGGDARYRRALCFYCLRLGLNTFIDQLFDVMSCYGQNELDNPARAFHARLRKLTTHIFGRIRKGGAR